MREAEGNVSPGASFAIIQPHPDTLRMSSIEEMLAYTNKFRSQFFIPRLLFPFTLSAIGIATNFHAEEMADFA